MNSIRDEFLIDPEIVFLNHGSFGACPRPVFEVCQEWQRRLERQPVEFLGRKFDSLMAEARASLAEFLGAEAGEVVYFPNPTTAVNMVVRSLSLSPGDEILATDHEYGAMDRTWRYICKKTGARYINRQVPLPLQDEEAFCEHFWNGVNEHTRIIFLSHITSSTAIKFPIEEIVRRARNSGILTIIDGAHAPGQIPVNLSEIGADIYTGACHKWLCAPKGAAFLYARKEVQAWLEPLVVSWGYEAEKPGPSQFIDYNEWQGTRDISAFLTVPEAIRYQQKHRWEAVRARCRELAVSARRRINAWLCAEPVCPEEMFSQMFTAWLPDGVNPEALKEKLYEDYRIEVPITCWNEKPLIRVSIQAYNLEADVDRLVKAVQELFPR